MDEIIDRELRGLRNPVESKHGLGDAILAMTSAPVSTRKLTLRWPIGVGSVALAVGAVLVVGSLTTGKAYAGELSAIASAQEQQKTMHQVAYIFAGEAKAQQVNETWIDRENQATRQYSKDGKLQYATSTDGKKSAFYSVGSENVNPSASIDWARGEGFRIETITMYVQSDFFSKHSIEKTEGISLNGRTCDLYNFAKGYYKVWVDPKTKLPIQREVYSRGNVLWERDVYDYPATMSSSTFTPAQIPGLPYYDYTEGRKQLEARLREPGKSQTVGNVTITLKAIIQDYRQVRAIWSTTGVDGWKDDRTSDFDIVGVRRSWVSVGDMSSITLDAGQNVLNQEICLEDGKAFKLPGTIRIAAYEVDKGVLDQHGKVAKRFVGWATFTVKENDIMRVPFNGNLFRSLHPSSGGVATAKSGD